MPAELLLAPLVEVTISKVISVATEHLKLVLDYEEDLRSFLVTLEMARGLLQHAEQKKATEDPGVKVWLRELLRLADGADNVMDEIAYERLKRKVAQKQVRHFLTPSNPLVVPLRMACKIKKLNDALAKLNSQAIGFGFQSILANKQDPESSGLVSQTDASLGDPSLIVGREGDVQEIVRLLTECNTDKPLGVVSVAGVGGLGKTTLAKLVCNHKQTQRYFSKIMWVCISENFDVFNILREMLQSLTLAESSGMGITNRDALVNRIKKELDGKNYLLVLDDVWNAVDEGKWEDLKRSLFDITKE